MGEMAAMRMALPLHMAGQPYGTDDAGCPLNRTKGTIVRFAIEYTLECAGVRTAQALPPDLDSKRGSDRIKQAKSTVLAEIIERLNAAFNAPLYQVTRDFPYNRGTKSVPPSLAYLGRPFLLAQVYSVFPRFVTKLADTEFSVVRVTDHSAVIQWRAEKDLVQIPSGLVPIFLD